MSDCFDGELQPERIERFTRYTLADHDHREYKWTWCGRYSVPFGLLVGVASPADATRSAAARTRSSATRPRSTISASEVDDLDGMGVTAPATLRHWVGYAAVGFR